MVYHRPSARRNRPLDVPRSGELGVQTIAVGWSCLATAPQLGYSDGPRNYSLARAARVWQSMRSKECADEETREAWLRSSCIITSARLLPRGAARPRREGHL